MIEAEPTLADQLRNEHVEFCLSCNVHVKTFFAAGDDNHCPKCGLEIVGDQDKRKRQVEYHPWRTV
jgi:predicted RNA-binding Zn-ribbon protein involved in translation (DUF1610 family)